jgi:CubicO group peptidase (beta-lactamase class C family)
MRILSTLLIIFAVTAPNCPAQNDSFERISPEQAGFSTSELKKLRTYLEEAGSSSLILASNGKIFFEWGDIHKKLTVHSIRKPLLNSLFGIYFDRGMIDTTLTLRELAIDDIEPGLTETEKEARIADLLKSRSGIYHPAAAESDGMIAAKPQRGLHQPGEAFYYNNWDFNVLGYIFEHQTGKSIYEAFLQDVALP